MLNILRLHQETVNAALNKFTREELEVLLDVYSGKWLDPGIVQNPPAVIEYVAGRVGWNVNPEVISAKLRDLSAWEIACLVIWAVDFSSAGLDQEPGGREQYIGGRLSPLLMLRTSVTILEEAIRYQEATKAAFKSKQIAESRERSDRVLKVLKNLTY